MVMHPLEMGLHLKNGRKNSALGSQSGILEIGYLAQQYIQKGSNSRTVIRTETLSNTETDTDRGYLSGVEAALSRQRELSESTKDKIRSRIASTIQSASLHGSNLTKDE